MDAVDPKLTVDQAMAYGRSQGLARLDVQVLLGHVLSSTRSWLLTHGEAPLSPAQTLRFVRSCSERASGVPVAYLVGHREFHGLTLRVTRDVLDPRPDTEVLVEWALSVLDGWRADRPQPTVLDLGTGSGAVALAIKRACPAAQVTAVDRSAAALAVAQCNARQQGLTIEALQGDWFRPLGGRRFDLIVSNPPYIAEADPHLLALHAEPREALVAGADGLEALRTLARDSPSFLLPAGGLLLEHGAEQAVDVARVMADAGFLDIQHRRDLGGHLRCTGGHLRTSKGA